MQYDEIYLGESGYRPDSFDRRDFAFEPRFGVSLGAPDAVPIEVDNRAILQQVRDQGSERACVGFAVCAAAQALYGLTRGQPVDLSERWVCHYARKYDPWPGTNYVGTSIRGALRGWQNHGICLEQYWRYIPYPVRDTSPHFNIDEHEGMPDAEMAESARDYPVHGYYRVRQHRTELKRAIFLNHVVIFGARIHTGWMRPRDGTIQFDNASHPRGDHAFLLVGYDDRRSAFLVANSWGTRWGEQGFAWMGYCDVAVNGQDAWVVTVPKT